MIKLENIGKQYQGTVAVKELNLETTPGEVFVLLGPTGAGKTTTLRIAAGLENPDAGNVFIDGRNVTSAKPWMRDVALVFEGLNLFPIYSVFDNIAFALRSQIYREPEDVIKQRIDQVSKDLSIEHLLDRMPETLSGGEIQRVAIARALVRRPLLYLFDEPLSNLDLKLREQLQVELKAIYQKYESTILFATHDYIGAAAIADRIGILYDGHMHQVGTQQALHTDPATTVVATLMGNPAMNLLSVTRDGNRFISVKDTTIFFEPAHDKQLTSIKSDNLLLGLWPEDILISLESQKGYFKTRIYGQEYRGADRVISLAIGEEKLRKVVDIDFPGRYGDACWFSYNPHRIYIYDGTNGARLLL